MKAFNYRHVSRLGMVLALVLVAAAFVFVVVSGTATGQGTPKEPSTKNETGAQPSARTDEENLGDFWISLKDKGSAEAQRSIEDEIREILDRMEQHEKRMDQMMRHIWDMDRDALQMPHRWWTPRSFHGFSHWMSPDIEAFLRELEREFKFRDKPFGFRTPSPGDRFFSLRMNTRETKDAYILKLDIPGMEKGDINIEVTGDTLTVSGERKERIEEKQQDGKKMRSEISYGRFEQTLRLADDANTEKITSQYNDGVLTITVPKKEQKSSGSRRIIVHRP